jgi:hypothetical protein
MNFDYRETIPAGFHDTSRVWIYQSSRLFTIPEAFQIEDMLKAFVLKWQSHGIPVKGYANLLYGQFIILMADETATGVSGCSTDSSVRIIKQIEEQFAVNMFDRQMLAFLVKIKFNYCHWHRLIMPLKIITSIQILYTLITSYLQKRSCLKNGLFLLKKVGSLQE